MHILVDSDEVRAPPGLADNPRLVRTNIGERMTWRLGFEHAARLQGQRPGQRIIAIVANSDIWFDET